MFIVIPLRVQCVHTCCGHTLDISSNVLYNMYTLYNKEVYVWAVCLAPLRRERTFQN